MEKDEAFQTTLMLKTLDWIKRIYVKGFVPIKENISGSVSAPCP